MNYIPFYIKNKTRHRDRKTRHRNRHRQQSKYNGIGGSINLKKDFEELELEEDSPDDLKDDELVVGV